MKPAIFPTPVLMIGTYNEDGSINVMNLAWGVMSASNIVELNILPDHRTTENIRRNKAFALAVATEETMAQSDYLGMVSEYKVPDKFEKTGFHAVKSEFVNAPVIVEYPLTMECELKSMEDGPEEMRVLGIVKNVLAEEGLLGSDGKMDVSRLHAIVWDNFKGGYYRVTEKVGQSFSEGKKLITGYE